MSSNWPKAGPNHVPSYIASGIPYVTMSTGAGEVPDVSSSTLKFSFPFVTKFFQIENTGGNVLRVGFSNLGVKGAVTKNYFTVPASGKSDVLDMRCKELYFGGQGGTTDFRIIAGMTLIQATEFPELTGSLPGTTGTTPTASFGGVG